MMHLLSTDWDDDELRKYQTDILGTLLRCVQDGDSSHAVAIRGLTSIAAAHSECPGSERELHSMEL